MDRLIPSSAAEVARGLTLIRRRRSYLWGALLIYLPLLKVTMLVTPSTRVMLCVVVLWLLFTFTITFFAALARCPRCGHYFHLHGPTLLFLRKCLHCQLHLRADRS